MNVLLQVWEDHAMIGIRSTLLEIGAINNSHVELFAPRTRDREVPVWRDRETGVVFIDNFYVGDDEYASGAYRTACDTGTFEDHSDTERRVQQFAPYYTGRSVIDFGCGQGKFLQSIRAQSVQVQGVELQHSFRNALNATGIACFATIEECASADVITLFHVLEHLPDPIALLASLKTKASNAAAYMIIEVPHAGDFLITHARHESFIEFTLWSQHLVLHTRDSLERLLRAAGLNEIHVFGVQRYGLANHINWLLSGKPGGHKGPLAMVETANLRSEYASALARLDATDTLVAIARI